MHADQLKALTLEGFERMFNNGDLDFIDTAIAPGAVDHQEPAGTDFSAHLKHIIRTLRTGFPDLHFAVDAMICEGHTVATRTTMTGTHQGTLRFGPLAGLPIVDKQVGVTHMHFFRYDDQGRLTDLWHVWNTIDLARQLGAPAPDLSATAAA